MDVYKAEVRISLQLNKVPVTELLLSFSHVSLFCSLGSRLLNHQKQDMFTLVVTVKDLAGMSENALTSNTDVEITVKENLWKAPPKASIKENSTEPHPIYIMQVGTRNHRND